jgi:putative transposase
MDTREVAAEYRLTQWARTIQTRAQSGQSIKEFCASSGISRNAYFYWQRKLREAACSEMHETATRVKKCLIPNGWKQLESVESDCRGASVTIEVSGCRITTTAETDLDLLAKVCRVLRSL